MKKLFLLPYPPPFAGPEIIAQAILESNTFKKRTDILHINANIQSRNSTKGIFSLIGVIRFIKIYYKILLSLFRVKILWFNLSPSQLGFLRDSIYIVTAKLMRIKIYTHYQGNNFRNQYKLRKQSFKKLITFSLNLVDGIVVADPTIKEDFKNIVPQAKMHVLYNGFNLEKFNFSKTSKPNPNLVNIFYIGHLTYPKGFYHLVLTYKQLYRKYKRTITFNFAGEYYPPSRTLADFLNDKENENYKKNKEKIHFEIENFIKQAKEYNAKYLGLLDFQEKIKYYNNADICVFPSFTESFGNTVVEAMLMGTAVVATKVGIFPNILIHTNAGLAVEFNNVNDLYNKISVLIENPELRKILGNNARKYCRENFDIEIIAEKLLKIISI